jgi:glutamine synthetase
LILTAAAVERLREESSAALRHAIGEDLVTAVLAVRAAEIKRYPAHNQTNPYQMFSALWNRF